MQLRCGYKDNSSNYIIIMIVIIIIVIMIVIIIIIIIIIILICTSDLGFQLFLTSTQPVWRAYKLFSYIDKYTFFLTYI